VIHFCEEPQRYLAKFPSAVNTEGLTLTDETERCAVKSMRLCVGFEPPGHTELVGIITLDLLPPIRSASDRHGWLPYVARDRGERWILGELNIGGVRARRN
jgi:hypothetical protein